MITYEINTDFFKKCLRVVSKEATRYNISGIFIHDDAEGIRHYVGTNGHILVHCKEKHEGPTLEKGIIIRPTAALGTRKCCRYVPMKVYDEQTAVIDLNKRILCDIIDGTYPSYEKVIPTDVKPEYEYISFNPEYLLEMKRILGSATVRPVSSSPTDPHIFRTTNEVEVVIMPMRI